MTVAFLTVSSSVVAPSSSLEVSGAQAPLALFLTSHCTFSEPVAPALNLAFSVVFTETLFGWVVIVGPSTTTLRDALTSGVARSSVCTFSVTSKLPPSPNWRTILVDWSSSLETTSWVSWWLVSFRYVHSTLRASAWFTRDDSVTSLLGLTGVSSSLSGSPPTSATIPPSDAVAQSLTAEASPPNSITAGSYGPGIFFMIATSSRSSHSGASTNSLPPSPAATWGRGVLYSTK